MLQDLVNGNIDAAFIQSGWIEGNYPEVLPSLRFLDVTNRTYQGERHPFPVTTTLVPHYGLAASPSVSWLLREQVSDALSHLNKSHPAARAAGIAKFVLPGPYGLARDLALQVVPSQ